MDENKPNKAISKYVRSRGHYLSPFTFFNHLAFLFFQLILLLSGTPKLSISLVLPTF